MPLRQHAHRYRLDQIPKQKQQRAELTRRWIWKTTVVRRSSIHRQPDRTIEEEDPTFNCMRIDASDVMSLSAVPDFYYATKHDYDRDDEIYWTSAQQNACKTYLSGLWIQDGISSIDFIFIEKIQFRETCVMKHLAESEQIWEL